MIKKLSYILSRKQRWQFFGIFILQLIATALDFLGISLILPFVNILVNPAVYEGAWWYQFVGGIIGSCEARDVLLFLTVFMIGIYVVKNAYLLALTGIQTKFNYANYVRMGGKMINCFMHKPYTYHLQRNTAEIIRNINQDVNSAFSVISSLFGLISDFLMIGVLVAYLFAVEPWMTLGVIAALLLCSAVYFLLVRRKIRTFGEDDRKIGARMIKAINQSMGGIKEVKIMGREKYFSDAYVEAGTEYTDRRQRYAIIRAIPSRLIETLCIGTILTIIAVKISTGQDLSGLIPGLSAFAVAAIKLLPRANSINSRISSLTYAMPSLDALYEELKESELQEKEQAEEIARKKAENRHVDPGEERDIFVKHATFTYPNKEEPVLKDVSLKIEHGTSVGIVGVTGAGKTTLVDLILGVLKPDSGSVCYGALDIHQDYSQWQKYVGYIPQNIYLVDDTIRRNVALGVPDGEIREEDVWKALEKAQLADFVRSLKDGLDTVIGERGIRISGGQRQRVGIARALYLDPEILFFDEATSSLDNETEAAVMESVNALGGEKTMIIVAHRLSTIEHCDRILRVEDGKITEER